MLAGPVVAVGKKEDKSRSDEGVIKILAEAQKN
jgi:hypothetical protein